MATVYALFVTAASLRRVAQTKPAALRAAGDASMDCGFGPVS
jgi:hypothetical protein